MKTALVIQHVAFEDLGSLSGVLAQADYRVRCLEAALTDFEALDTGGTNLLIVLGGPIGACDDRDYPFLIHETRLIEARLRARLPTLGICLGAQLMARALGAAVYPAGRKEIGWSPVTLSAPGRASCLTHLGAPPTPVLHWHGDTFDLPAGAQLLASTAACAHQAFSVGANALALQFHPEVTAQGLERWLVGHAVEIAATPGVSAEGLRADTARCAGELGRRAERVFASWLSGLAQG